jgi:hypothetical protein
MMRTDQPPNGIQIPIKFQLTWFVNGQVQMAGNVGLHELMGFLEDMKLGARERIKEGQSSIVLGDGTPAPKEVT